MTLRRLVSAVLGVLILIPTLIQCYFQSVGFYQDHYTWQMEKYGVVIPLTRHDKVFLVVFWIVAVAMLYVSYRLLRYALWPPREKDLN